MFFPFLWIIVSQYNRKCLDYITYILDLVHDRLLSHEALPDKSSVTEKKKVDRRR